MPDDNLPDEILAHKGGTWWTGAAGDLTDFTKYHHTRQYTGLERENERLREALKFYADEATYDPNGVNDREAYKEGRPTMDVYLMPAINNDMGEKARQALKETT